MLYFLVLDENDNKIIFYTGITNDMSRRQKEHNDGKCRTSNRFNKSYNLTEIKFERVDELAEYREKQFKRKSVRRKLIEIENWARWTG